MKRLFSLGVLACLFICILSCNAQTKRRAGNNVYPGGPGIVGGDFENREFTYIGMPNKRNAVDTSPGWSQAGQKILLTGTVYEAGGQLPAPGVLIYYYHTNTEGRYVHNPNIQRSLPPNAKGQTHGYIRGWVNTDANGQYSIYTVRPGSYPSTDEPAHIHLSLKEPNTINEYYIDDILFDDDKNLTTTFKTKLQNRGGSGIIKLMPQQDILVGTRNIILGLNIPNYPEKSATGYSPR